jgi:hypothetical protein
MADTRSCLPSSHRLRISLRKLILASATVLWLVTGAELSTGAGYLSAEEPPTGTKEATPPKRLRLDVDGQVQRMLEKREGLLHFETAVEVVGTSPQAMLDRHLQGVDPECGPPAGGAPTEAEMRQAQPHAAPYLDFLPLLRALRGKITKKGADHYFLYRVHQGDRVSYSLREERLPDALLYNPSGTTFELVEAFPDRDTATSAWWRLERGLQGPYPKASPLPVPPWATSPCSPGRSVR